MFIAVFRPHLKIWRIVQRHSLHIGKGLDLNPLCTQFRVSPYFPIMSKDCYQLPITTTESGGISLPSTVQQSLIALYTLRGSVGGHKRLTYRQDQYLFKYKYLL